MIRSQTAYLLGTECEETVKGGFFINEMHVYIHAFLGGTRIRPGYCCLLVMENFIASLFNETFEFYFCKFA